MSYLLDTGFLYALLNDKEPEHSAIVEVIRSIHSDIILPIPVITEIAYLLKRDLGTEAAADFIASLSSTPLILLVPEPDDYQRAAEFMRQYADANLDFVDALIAALAERLNISRILTLDQRDFRLIRPRHCNAFEIHP